MEEGVIRAIWEMELDKALGPDGFSIHFFRACLGIIKKNLCKMLN